MTLLADEQPSGTSPRGDVKEASKQPLLDIVSARDLLRRLIPDWYEILARLEIAASRVQFREEVSDMITRLNARSYPLLYECSATAGLLVMQALSKPEKTEAFNFEAEGPSSSVRAQGSTRVIDQSEGLGAAMDWSATSRVQARERDASLALDGDTHAGVVRLLRYWVMASLATFYEHLSVVVHGQTLSTLISRAKTGDDQAYGMAVQIDGQILTGIPYFSKRFARASRERDAEFLGMVLRRRAGPPYKGRIKHKRLWMTFAYLEARGLLSSLTEEQLIDFCEHLGVGDRGPRIGSSKNLREQLAEYRRFQKSAIIREKVN